MIKLWEGEVPGFDNTIKQEVPNITPYILETGTPKAAVIVCPGGGYSMKADHEGEPIARWLNSIGISAFVLDYRVTPYKHPYPLLDAQRVIRCVRHMASEWNIDSKKICILGFSAGGHLAATAGTHFDYGETSSIDPIERVSCRPDAMILCYPVISFGEFTHQGSVINLIGDELDPELIEFLSNEKYVTKDTPPTFLWHTANDEAVPVENSIMFANELSKNKVQFALHVFSKGQHGLGLAEGVPSVSTWTDLCQNWLKDINFIE